MIPFLWETYLKIISFLKWSQIISLVHPSKTCFCCLKLWLDVTGLLLQSTVLSMLFTNRVFYADWWDIFISDLILGYFSFSQVLLILGHLSNHVSLFVWDKWKLTVKCLTYASKLLEWHRIPYIYINFILDFYLIFYLLSPFITSCTCF